MRFGRERRPAGGTPAGRGATASGGKRPRALWRAAGLALVGLVTLVQPAPARASEFDLTGTLDCGVRSGRQCVFTDWETGPTLGVLTYDVSGTLERVLVNTAWIRDDLTSFGQDDFVWFTVEDGHGPQLQVTGVIEHRCNDGIPSTGLVNQGQSHGGGCFPTESGKEKNDPS